MGADYIPIEEAARRSGLHLDTLKRLLRKDEIRGFKATHNGRHRWLVSVVSLRQYTDPFDGFLLTKPGPKLFLKRVDDEIDDGDDAEDGFE